MERVRAAGRLLGGAGGQGKERGLQDDLWVFGLNHSLTRFGGRSKLEGSRRLLCIKDPILYISLKCLLRTQVALGNYTCKSEILRSRNSEPESGAKPPGHTVSPTPHPQPPTCVFINPTQILPPYLRPNPGLSLARMRELDNYYIKKAR